MKAIDKIKKLLALSQSSNENEAAAALAKAMEIAADEGIDMAEAEAAILNEDISTKMFSKPRLKIPKWELSLATGISEMFGCRAVTIGSYRPQSWRYAKQQGLEFAGYPSDLEICIYVYEYLKRQVKKLANEHMKTKRFRKRVRRENYKTDYLYGMVLRVILTAKKFYNRDHSNGTPGLVVKRGVMIDRWLKDLGAEDHDFSSKTKRQDAFHAGYSDGSKVGISHGVNAGKPMQIKQ